MHQKNRGIWELVRLSSRSQTDIAIYFLILALAKSLSWFQSHNWKPNHNFGHTKSPEIAESSTIVAKCLKLLGYPSMLQPDISKALVKLQKILEKKVASGDKITEKFPAATADIVHVAWPEEITKQANIPYPPISANTVLTNVNPDPVIVTVLGIPSYIIEGFRDTKEIGAFNIKTPNPEAITLYAVDCSVAKDTATIRFIPPGLMLLGHMHLRIFAEISVADDRSLRKVSENMQTADKGRKNSPYTVIMLLGYII
jgi:hypothetical protein